MSDAPLMTVVLVAGPARERAQRVVDLIDAQTIAHQIELVIVDIVSDADALKLPAGLQASIAAMPGETFTRARIAGARRARAPVVAFVEDHVLPDPEWAAALVEAHQGPWLAVGYGFYNANPETYASRAAMMTDYGWWVHVAPRGPARSMASHNLSYKRDFFLSFGDELETLSSPDQVLLEILGARGEPLFIETRARAGHWNITSIPSLWAANMAFGRLHAAHRAQARRWTMSRRFLYGLVICPIAPATRLYRFARALRGREAIAGAIEVSPVLMVAYVCSSVGAALGYLGGPGRSERAVEHYDLFAKR